MYQVCEIDGVGRFVYDIINRGTPRVCITDIRPAPAVKDLVIPATIEGYPVTNLLSFAGGGHENDHVVSITVPEGVESISHSFSDYKALERVSLPHSIKKIGLYAFGDCVKLRDIPLPEGLEELSYGAFSGCEALGDITLPQSLKKLEIESYERQVNVFEHAHVKRFTLSAKQLTKFPRVLKRVWADEVVITGKTDDSDTGREFLRNSRLKKITLPHGMTEIGEEAFQDCTRLEEIVTPDPLTRLGMCSFELCSSLKSIALPPTIDAIPYRCFYYCTSLADIDLSHIKEIGSYAFARCESLTRVVLSEALVSLDDEVFANCTALEEAVLSASITKLPSLTFEGCTSLKTVTLPAALETIGYAAFRDCTSLTSLHIPASVTEIEAHAFANCPALKGVTVDASNPVYFAKEGVLYLKETDEKAPVYD